QRSRVSRSKAGRSIFAGSGVNAAGRAPLGSWVALGAWVGLVIVVGSRSPSTWLCRRRDDASPPPGPSPGGAGTPRYHPPCAPVRPRGLDTPLVRASAAGSSDARGRVLPATLG